MNIFKSILIAFSIYSRIPVPTFEWGDVDYRHSISFLPLVGVVIGVLVGIATIFEDLPVFVLTAIFSVIPLIVTGGFHLDGFMDVYDAKSSFSEKEKSLEIMKDPHIGAFATIGLLKLVIIWAGALYL
ncbi:MAG: adenosylcobinamide-GDP ribazoletransferase, partial [Butyrivibrio sp.]|nr:adenosylcobinamide-GDP ribazoletransferase [Butyrivibrio sp.]